jgi:hypothetical protein
MPRGYPTIDREQCSVDDCDRLEVVKGLCRMHYTRLHRHGSTDKPTQRKAPTPGLKRRPRPPSGRAAAYRSGDKIGCYTYLRHGEPRLRAGGRGTRTALIVRCDCGRVSSKLAQEVKPESVYCSPVCPIRAERAASNAPRVAPPKPRKPRIKAAAPKPKTVPAPRQPKPAKPPKPVRQQLARPPKPAKEHTLSHSPTSLAFRWSSGVFVACAAERYYVSPNSWTEDRSLPADARRPRQRDGMTRYESALINQQGLPENKNSSPRP